MSLSLMNDITVIAFLFVFLYYSLTYICDWSHNVAEPDSELLDLPLKNFYKTTLFGFMIYDTFLLLFTWIKLQIYSWTHNYH